MHARELDRQEAESDTGICESKVIRLDAARDADTGDARRLPEVMADSTG